MLDTNVTVDYKSQSFETPSKNNHINDAPSAQILLESDPLKCHHNIKTHMIHRKLPPYGKEYLSFHTYGRTF